MCFRPCLARRFIPFESAPIEAVILHIRIQLKKHGRFTRPSSPPPNTLWGRTHAGACLPVSFREDALFPGPRGDPHRPTLAKLFDVPLKASSSARSFQTWPLCASTWWNFTLPLRSFRARLYSCKPHTCVAHSGTRATKEDSPTDVLADNRCCCCKNTL